MSKDNNSPTPGLFHMDGSIILIWYWDCFTF